MISPPKLHEKRNTLKKCSFELSRLVEGQTVCSETTFANKTCYGVRNFSIRLSFTFVSANVIILQ